MSGSFSYLFLSILYYFGEFWENVREFWDMKYRVATKFIDKSHYMNKYS